MKLKRYAVLAAICTVALMGLSLTANAQNYRGKFTLPAETHWGSATLQPGEYTVSAEYVGSTTIIYVMGEKSVASILPGPIAISEASSDNGRIELTEVNGTRVVTRFTTPSQGKEYSFSIPKSVARKGFGAVALKKAAIPLSN